MNLDQARAGLAWHYKHYEKTQQSADRRLYAEAEWRRAMARFSACRARTAAKGIESNTGDLALIYVRTL